MALNFNHLWMEKKNWTDYHYKHIDWEVTSHSQMGLSRLWTSYESKCYAFFACQRSSAVCGNSNKSTKLLNFATVWLSEKTFLHFSTNIASNKNDRTENLLLYLTVHIFDRMNVWASLDHIQDKERKKGAQTFGIPPQE